MDFMEFMEIANANDLEVDSVFNTRKRRDDDFEDEDNTYIRGRKRDSDEGDQW